jgi:hypothetical protein
VVKQCLEVYQNINVTGGIILCDVLRAAVADDSREFGCCAETYEVALLVGLKRHVDQSSNCYVEQFLVPKCRMSSKPPSFSLHCWENPEADRHSSCVNHSY